MIWDIYRDREIKAIPHKREYKIWISRLTTQQVETLKEEIRKRIAGNKVATAGWIPGLDWNDTPFQLIYEIACKCDKEASGMCFGLLVWETLMEHEDCWGFGRYELNKIPIKSITYFKINKL